MNLKGKFTDHIESVCEELKEMGFNAYIRDDTIHADAFFGFLYYKCSERTVMGDVYRFCNHFGSKLSKWGLENKIRESKQENL